MIYESYCCHACGEEASEQVGLCETCYHASLEQESKWRKEIEALKCRLANLERVVDAVKGVRFGYAGDIGNTVSGWKAVEDALEALNQEPR